MQIADNLVCIFIGMTINALLAIVAELATDQTTEKTTVVHCQNLINQATENTTGPADPRDSKIYCSLMAF